MPEPISQKKLRDALSGGGVNPLEFGCRWIALVDRETGQELTNRLLYVEDGPDLNFDVIEPGTGVIGWFVEEHGGKALFWTWPQTWAASDFLTASWLKAEKTPHSAGWWPVLRCWDTEEGYFPGGEHWDGSKWSDSAVVAWIDQRCSSKEDAAGVAEANDPGW